MSCYSITGDKRLQRMNLKGLYLLRKFLLLEQVRKRFPGMQSAIEVKFIMKTILSV